MFTYSIYKPYSYVSICPWDSIPGKEPMVAECISEMASSSARNLMIPLANVSDQPGKVCVVRPLEELTRAIQKGERIWHEE